MGCARQGYPNTHLHSDMLSISTVRILLLFVIK